jgi:SpoIID/LytB domain protein
VVVVGVIFLSGFGWAADSECVPLETLQVRVRLASSKTIEIRSVAPIMVRSAKGKKELPAGAYVVDAASVTAPGRRYRLFIKTFRPSQEREARDFVSQWKAQGYSPEVVIFGRKFSSGSGVVVDNRSQWVSVARFDTEKQAAEKKAQLESQNVFGWIVSETVGEGAATIRISNGGKVVAQGAGPLTFASSGRLEAPGIERGFWNPRHVTMSFTGTLEAGAGADGLLNLMEIVPVEEYLAGVLPAEMPASWPAEALKAQAVAARTEVLSALGGKHMLDGFDFCATEHCRAYGAFAGRQASTDGAVAGTRGAVLIRDGRFAATVFSANCGGCSENNDTVWSAPADGALRAVSDVKGGKMRWWRDGGIEKWLKQPPDSYCGHRSENFRWTRHFSGDELSGIVNKRHRVGKVRRIELLERGTGGRLTAVKITGGEGTEVVKKELNIRLAFGGLPSAMFIVETRGARDPSAFTFVGGGRGHGVGLCQDGACGMALAGKTSLDILHHYYSGVEMARLD